jgi:hypothetical protein
MLATGRLTPPPDRTRQCQNGIVGAQLARCDPSADCRDVNGKELGGVLHRGLCGSACFCVFMRQVIPPAPDVV